jgi:hypothetical protein
MGANLERRLKGRFEGNGHQSFGLFVDVRHLSEIWSPWKRPLHVTCHSEYAKLASKYIEQSTVSME